MMDLSVSMLGNREQEQLIIISNIVLAGGNLHSFKFLGIHPSTLAGEIKTLFPVEVSIKRHFSA